MRPTKYPREKISGLRITRKKHFRTLEITTKARWHDGTRPAKPAMTRDPLNLAHSYFDDFIMLFKIACHLKNIFYLTQTFWNPTFNEHFLYNKRL